MDKKHIDRIIKSAESKDPAALVESVSNYCLLLPSQDDPADLIEQFALADDGMFSIKQSE